MESSSSTPRSSARIAWAIAVLGVVALALFLRVYWNVDAAVTEPGHFRLAAGSDPYYHKRAIDWIQEHEWSTLIRDDLLNYPYGSANPNPPLFEWTVAASGLLVSPFFGGDLATATWWAFLWNPAVMGALTVLPIYVLGASLFGRKTGLLASIFWALSASSLDHTGLGASDHDAFYLFFLVTGFAFYVKFIQAVRADPSWVTRWSDGGAVASGLRSFFKERRVALGYATLAGVSLAAVALTWKGFPYATGIVFVYASLQLVVDHWRNRDSLGLWIGSTLAIGLPVLLALPYYSAAGVLNFLLPSSYIVLAFVVAGLVLVPTRDMPSLLVLPGAAVVGAIAVALTFVVPALAFVRIQLLYATVYFRQSRLYTTIAEAHPASFDDIVFGIGPVVFLVGLVALGWLIVQARRGGTRAMLFTFVWGVLAIYMAQSAVRFLFNAVPVFVVLGGWLIARAIDWFDFGGLARSVSSGAGVWGGFRRAFSPWHAVGALGIILLLVVPSVLLAVDAAVPGEVEARIADEAGEDSALAKFIDKRLGAYTQGFLPGYWEEGLEWLDDHDADIPPSERPAFLSWWDYGHWAIAVGRHPASADNFQNGYVHAGNFIAAQNETHAIQLLAARQFERENPDLPASRVKELLRDVGVADVDAAFDRLRAFEFVSESELDLDRSAAFLAAVEAETGDRIRYFAVDSRMLPYDSPSTAYIDLQGIFYAPIYLAEKDIDDFVETRFTGSDGRDYNQSQVEAAIRQSSRQGTQFSVTAESYVYRDAFFNSMFWRTWSGAPPRGEGPWRGDALEDGLDGPAPAHGLKHFRVVYMSNNLRILEYYPGATVSGVVTQDGRPLAGVLVTALDDAGDLVIEHAGPRTRSLATNASQLDVAHDRALTDADGRFTLVAPFSMSRGTTIVAIQSGVEVGRVTVPVTREQAQGVDLGDVASFDVKPGIVSGRAFFDRDGNGAFNESVDEYVGGVNLTIGGVTGTTGDDGSFTIAGVAPGSRTVSTSTPRFDVGQATRSVIVRPGETTEHDVALTVRSARAGGVIATDVDGDGQIAGNEAIASFPYEIRADADVGGNTARTASGVTAANGTWSATLPPGSYVYTATYTDKDGNAYAIEDRFTIPEGSVTFRRDFLLLRS